MLNYQKVTHPMINDEVIYLIEIKENKDEEIENEIKNKNLKLTDFF